MKRIIIIGATSGIGKALALLYAAEGHLVAISGRRQNLLEEIQATFPQQIKTACFDATGAGNKKAFQQLLLDLGGLDLFIYNAGGGRPSGSFEVEAELATTRLNVLGCVELVGQAFTFLLEQGYGQIAITSSVAALRGNSRAPAYSASKAFVSNFAEGLNLKALRSKKAIVVTDIRPGFVNTHPASGHPRFWMASPQKAARQMKKAIDEKKRVAYITRRWWLVAQVLKRLPFTFLRRLL